MTIRASRNRPRPLWSRHRTAFERAAISLAALLLASILFAVESRAVTANGELCVWFFDVGQGDATFVVMPTGEQILIDGGPDRAVLAKLGEVMPPWDRTIDLVVATHPDADHIGGLASVLERYEVARVVTNGDEKDTDAAVSFLAARDAEPGAAIETGRRGSTLRFGDVVLTELWPTPAAVAGEDANVASIAYRLDYGETSVLLMGDAPEEVEADVVASAGDVDVLKAGHHGSASSSSYAFVQSVRPEFVVVSCGEGNRYGHPHPAVLERFAEVGASVYRTDLDGDILLTSDGNAPTMRAAPLPF